MSDRAQKRPLWREPLLHFLLAGALLVGLDALVRTTSTPSGTIRVSSRQIDELEEQFTSRHDRAPTASELENLVDTYVEKEILVREALSMGLHRNDPIVRRRLVQAMRFLHEDREPIPEPTDRELREHFQKYRSRYRKDASITLEHVRFREGDPATRDGLDDELASLRSGADWRSMGRPFIRGRRLAHQSREELSNIFGDSFVKALRNLPVDRWSGPISSRYGRHLVRISRRTGEEVDFESVRDEVRRDLLKAKREQANRRAMRRLRRQYRVEVAGDLSLADEEG